MLTPQERQTKHMRTNGPRHRVQLVAPEVEEFIRLAQEGTKPPYIIGQWMTQWLSRRLDTELELLASTALSMELDDLMRDPAVMGALQRGRYEEGLRQLMSRCRRRFAKLLRDHQRADDDDFLDAAEVD